MRIVRDTLGGSPLNRSSENLVAHFALATSPSSPIQQQYKPALRPRLFAVAHRPYQAGWRPQLRAQISAMRRIILTGVAVLALFALAVWFFAQRRKQSHRLEQHFAPEYGRTVAAFGSRRKAESELKARKKRAERFAITPLAPAEAARFSQAWSALQARFVDNPKGVVMQADQLVRGLMLKRSYPMGDFERRAGDISVDHPAIVETYRAAQAIVVRDARGVADTEELRKAVVHYRALFDELLEVRAAKQEAIPATQLALNT